MSAGVLLYLWNKWRIQLLVLSSFALQLFLLAFAGIRRRSSSKTLRISLWSAYLLADSTAIYALGHLSIIGEHQLGAFWAPFLLLHLGGPDNITAYSLEDNRLWLRHLQTLVVQALAAAYVLYKYKYMVSSGTLLPLASISMFVVGLLKYAERTWALKTASGYATGIWNLFETVVGGRYMNLMEDPISDEDTLRHAHIRHVNRSISFPSPEELYLTVPVRPTEVTWLYKLVAMELSLIYDILYTKAAVIYTGYGLCVHLISLLGTTTSFVLFQLSISSPNRHNRSDVIISYVLLVGALVLEIMSVCRILLSSWCTYFLLDRWRWVCRWDWLPISYLFSLPRRLINPASRRLWRHSIGQYNLIHLSTCDRTKLWSRLAKMMGFENRWNKLHFSGTFLGTNSLSMQHLEVLVAEAVLKHRGNDHGTNYSTRGASSLERREVYKGLASWSVNIDFDLSILVWHIATDMCIQESDIEHAEQLIEAIRVLSNYMIFLLLVKPNILPGPTHFEAYHEVSSHLDYEWRKMSREGKDSVKSCTTFWNPYHILKELFCHEGPSSSGVELEDKFMHHLLHEEAELPEMPNPRGRHHGILCIMMATGLARELLLMELSGRDKLEMIFEVWVEMMLYAANYCSQESHTRELSNGGEFITIVGFLAKHLQRYTLKHDDPESPSVDSHMQE